MKTSPLKVLCLPVIAMSLASPSRAETYRVGAKRDIKSLKQIAPKLQAGDVVEIDGGTYREALKITAQGTAQAPITIRGVGAERPLFDGEGLDLSGRGPIPRGIFQIEGAYITIEHLAFKNARNKENAAGIRLLASTNATIRDCLITHCEMGVFGDDLETATIENSEIAFGGAPEREGYAHNFYMHGNRVVVRRCYIHDCLYGQNYKTRAHYNELLYNWISDSSEGEVGPVDSDETGKPNSNVLMVGNVVVSAQTRRGNPSKFVLFGSEMGKSHDGTLYLFHNTFVAGSNRNNFVTLADAKASVVMSGNIFVGSNNIFNATSPPLAVSGSHNWIGQNATSPAGLQSTLKGDPGFVDAEARDFRVRADSPLFKEKLAPLFYVDGDGITRHLDFDASRAPRPQLMAAPQTIGALGQG